MIGRDLASRVPEPFPHVHELDAAPRGEAVPQVHLEYADVRPAHREVEADVRDAEGLIGLDPLDPVGGLSGQQVHDVQVPVAGAARRAVVR